MKQNKLYPLLFLVMMFLGSNLCFSTEDSEVKGTIRFYLVRHGQTYSNIKEATIGGGGNAQLTPKGRHDAYALGMGFADANINFDAVYSSHLQRAYETATQILSGLGIENMPIKQVDGIQDIAWGVAEGGRISDLEEKYGVDGNDFLHYFGNYFEPDYQTPVAGTENTREFSFRFENALRKIALEHQGQSKTILITAHSTIGFYLSQFYKGEPKGTPNTSASVLDYKDGKFTLIDYGNTHYLERGYQLYNNTKPLKLMLVTSPETIFKEAGILEGTSDSNLSEAGVLSAKKLAEKVTKDSVKGIYSSDLNRSRATRALAFPTDNVPIIEDPRLNELFLGNWESEKYMILAKNNKRDFDLLFSNHEILQFPAQDGEGESIQHALFRYNESLRSIAEKYQKSEGGVVIFTHPFILNAYLEYNFPSRQKILDTEKMDVVTLIFKDHVLMLEAF